MLREWTVPSIIDNAGLQNGVCAKTSGLTTPDKVLTVCPEYAYWGMVAHPIESPPQPARLAFY